MSSTALSQDQIYANMEQCFGADFLKDINFNAHNFAYVVIVLLSQVGMNRAQGNIEDLGALQNSVSKAQTQFSSIQQFMSLLSGNTRWDGKNAYWPPNFTKDNLGSLQTFATSFGQFYWNTKSVNEDPSTTGMSLEITFTLSSNLKLGSTTYPQGSIVTLNPCDGSAMVNGVVYPNGGGFSSRITDLQTYIQHIVQWVTGNTSYTLPASANGTVPQFLAAAMANLQTLIDTQPGSFFNEWVAPGNQDLSVFAGSMESNALLSQAQNFYGLFASTSGVDGNSISSTLKAYFENEGSDPSTLWRDFGGAMALWMTGKMDNGSTAPSIPAPSGSIILDPSGMSQSELNSVVGYINTYLLGNLDPSSQDPYESIAYEDAQAAISYAQQGDYTNAIAYIQSARGVIYGDSKMTDLRGYADKAYADVERLSTYEADPMTESGFFSNISSSGSEMLAQLQPMSTQIASNVQMQSSNLTSYDQIGQAVVTAVNQELQSMTKNQLS